MQTELNNQNNLCIMLLKKYNCYTTQNTYNVYKQKYNITLFFCTLTVKFVNRNTSAGELYLGIDPNKLWLRLCLVHSHNHLSLFYSVMFNLEGKVISNSSGRNSTLSWLWLNHHYAIKLGNNTSVTEISILHTNL